MPKTGKEVVNDLINLAGSPTNTPEAAMKYSQAACNVANALRVLVDGDNALKTQK